jgi:hypothetical protein
MATADLKIKIRVAPWIRYGLIPVLTICNWCVVPLRWFHVSLPDYDIGPFMERWIQYRSPGRRWRAMSDIGKD